jgi:membrane-associated protease RseP (regulator of RpoE activity)
MDGQSVVVESKISALQAQLTGVLSVRVVQVLEQPDRVVSFSGRLLRDAESAYEALRERFRALGYTPSLQRQGESEVVIAHRGVITTQPSRVWINLVLFIATLLATLLTGAVNEVGQMVTNGEMIVPALLNRPILLLSGLPFALTIMSILLAHEMGHYLVGRRYNAPVSLPYFIPMPLVTPFGTMGAVIVQRAPFEDRKSLFDIGVAGPLAGMVVAIPLLIYGLATSHVGPIQPPALLEGNSILYLTIKYLIFGRILPGNGVDVMLNPIAWAAWGGLLVTALNLMPVGQFDGGHTLYALLGRRAWSIAMGVVVLLVAMGFLWPGWFIWALLALAFGARHPAPLNDLSLLDGKRRLVAIGVLILFVLIFTPIPLTEIR